MSGGIDYKAANVLWRRHRTALTRAVNRSIKLGTVEGHRAVIHLTVVQQQEWDANGWPWPDDWSRWQRAAQDAANAVRRLA